MKAWLKSLDLFIIIPVGFLVLFSYLFLNSYNGELASAHLRSILIGSFFYLLASFLPFYHNKRLIYGLYLVFVVVLIALLFIGETRGGATRWLSIGSFGFQPSEFAKIVFIVFIAHAINSFSTYGVKEFVILFLCSFVMFLLVALQPDLDNAIAFIVVFLIIQLFVVKKTTYFLYGMLIAIICSMALLPVAWQLLHDYQRQRVITFLQPSQDPLGAGYHSLQALITVGSGGFYGKGLGNGTQFRNNFLPEHTTDFAFASFAEEFGFSGAMTILVLFSVILLRFTYLAYTSVDSFDFYIYLGISAFLLVHLIANVGMNLGVLPVMGIALPFVSFGGSSMISFCALFGIAQGLRSPNLFYDRRSCFEPSNMISSRLYEELRNN